MRVKHETGQINHLLAKNSTNSVTAMRSFSDDSTAAVYDDHWVIPDLTDHGIKFGSRNCCYSDKL